MLFCRAQIIKKLHTVKPPVRDHLKCEDLLVAYRRPVVAFENRTTGDLFREEVQTSVLWKIIYCMQFLSCDVYSLMLSLRVLRIL